jgi:hypothetical protein
MSDEQQHDEANIPSEAVEDLAPEESEQDVSGGAYDAFLKIEGVSGESLNSNLKL